MSETSGIHAENTRIVPKDGVGMPKSRRADELDRDARLFLRLRMPFAGSPVAREQVSLFRQSWRFVATAMGRRIPVASVVEMQIDGPGGAIELRIYTPEGAPGPRPGFLWCHGGGFVVGDLDSTDSICRNVARAGDAVVVAVRYRLAPEHDLYAGREDFLAAVDWIREHGHVVGIDSARLAIGGDSAGGNIAAAVIQEIRRRRGPAPLLQVLVYPATDLIGEFPSKAENARRYFLTADFIDSLTSLVAQGRDLADPRLSPALSPDLRGLPPALIVTAGFDPIRDDGLAYASQLRAAGVPVELLHYSGQFHGFLNFDSVIGAARNAFVRIGSSLAAAYRGDEPTDRTIEISDQPSTSYLPLHETPQDLVTAAFMFSRLVRQMSDTTVRSLSSDMANALSLLLRPWWVPVALIRRSVTSYLDLLVARETYLPPGTHRAPHATETLP